MKSRVTRELKEPYPGGSDGPEGPPLGDPGSLGGPPPGGLGGLEVHPTEGSDGPEGPPLGYPGSPGGPFGPPKCFCSPSQ